MSNSVVPFGKYKGQPVEVMAQDKQYCEWLAAQAWFRSQFGGIHTIIVNNFGKPNDTPEHNALQAKFVDDGWVYSFLIHVFGGREKLKEEAVKTRKHFTDKKQKEKNYGWEHDPDMKARRDEEVDAQIEAFSKSPINWTYSSEFEAGGADVAFTGSFFIGNQQQNFKFDRDVATCKMRIECKPSVGDDYPSILRQMKKHESDTLLIGDGGFTATGATFDQVKKIFAASRIKIVLLSDIV